MPSSISRRPTCPLTRRESEQLLEFFINLPPVRAGNIEREKSYFQNNKECFCGNERPEFKRSDSYRQATQKFSVFDDKESVSVFKKEDYDHKKYLSLPVEKKSKMKNDKNKAPSTLNRKNKLNRKRSGTVPSSDSDNPSQPTENRKKKSVFTRTKERIIFKIWKDKSINDKRRKPRVIIHESSKIERSSNSEEATTADSIKGQRQDITIHSGSIDRTKTDSPVDKPLGSTTDMAPSKLHIDGRIKTQVSREEVTNMFQKILSSAEVREEPFKFPKRSPKKKDLDQSDGDSSHADGIKSKKTGMRLDLTPFSPNFTIGSRCVVSEDVTEISTDSSGHERKSHKHTSTCTSFERTFSLEVDGLDEIDGPVISCKSTDTKSTTEKAIDSPKNVLAKTEEEQMIQEIARRLNRIADDYVQRIGGDELQTTGAVARPILSPTSTSKKLASDLVHELRKEGDRLSRELNMPDSLLPIVMDMVKQITYDHFKELIKKALCETIGWDQVALYFYVSRAAIVMAGKGGRLASKLKDMTVRYFHEEISPWICDKGGLETMLDETDSEVD